MSNVLLQGDCLEVMKDIPDNSVDAVVTDPPYGLSFMGKKWDYDVPSKEIWVEAIRVLKPGGHLLSFGGTRTYHRMVINIEDAGFEIRDQIQWLYGSGFPKSMNIKEGSFKGWGTGLKPANEPIVMARKPLEKGLTVAENVIKYSCGAINIDASRIEAEKPIEQGRAGRSVAESTSYHDGLQPIERTFKSGRWPANIILDEIAAEILDIQAGPKPSPLGKNSNKSKGQTSIFGIGAGVENEAFRDGDKISRFFYVAKASRRERNAGLEGTPHKKSSEIGYGIRSNVGNRAPGKTSSEDHSSQNYHPTVKPIKLMEYLIKLITPPSGVVLDPFMGSGSTGIAAKNLGFTFIGIEKDENYFKIAEKRIGI